MKTIDTKGKACPAPIIMTKKALNELSENENLEILINNDISLKNVTRFLEDNGMKVLTEKEGAIYHLYVNKTGNLPESIPVENYCSTDQPINKCYAMVFKQNKLGLEEDELGTILMKAFINTLPEITYKPRWMIFFNTSIHLTVKGSPVIESLKKLEQDGVEIFVCGTCLNFFGKKDALAVGKISNMYDIIECMSRADKVIHP